MPRWSRAAYALLVTGLSVAYLALPDPPRLLWTAIGLAGVGAMALGIRVNRPAAALPWWLLFAGALSFLAGDTCYDLLTGPLGQDNPFPSVADVLYLVSYPLWAGGLLLMVRARSAGANRGALLDALIVTISVGLLSWVFLAKPYVEDASLGWLDKSISVGYPLGDILLLAVGARLIIGGAGRSRPLSLLAAGVVGLLVADVLYGLTQLNGAWSTGGPVDTGWIVFYAAWGAAALRPDMTSLVEPAPVTGGGLTRRRLLVLTAVSLAPSALLLVESQAARERFDAPVIAVASGALFLLVTARLDGFIVVAGRSAQRERALRRAGEALVVAGSREEIYQASARAVLEITGCEDPHRVLLALTSETGLRIAHDSAPGSTSAALDVAALARRFEAGLRQHHYVLTRADIAGGPGPGSSVLLVRLARDGAVVGLLVAVGSQVRRPGVIDAICALGTQTVLALESKALFEQVLQQRSETHFRSLIQNASDVILVVDPMLRIVYQTPSVQAVLGYHPEEIRDRPVTDLLTAEDADAATRLLARLVRGFGGPHQRDELEAEWQVRHADGALLRAEVTCRDLREDPSVGGLVLTLHDVTQRRILEEELKYLAFHDSLTGLPNRGLFLDRVEHALRRRGRTDERLAVMLIDLDDFKLVNDTRGHSVGDSLLVAVGERLRRSLRAGDTAARLGGDEFAILAEGLLGDEEASLLAARVLVALREPYDVDGEPMVVRASVGVATSGWGSKAAELLRQADLAMYAAKDAGKGTHEFFRPSLDDRMSVRIQLRRDLERGLERSEFLLHYQPVVQLCTGRVIGIEALVRWQHPSKGLIFPGDFIDAVEETELALPLGRWVLERAVAQAALWERAHPGPVPLRVSVNVAPRQLRDPDFAGMVAGTLARYGLPARALALEITERMLAGEDPQILAALSALRDLGVSLALDDFGTGYSALAYLRRFPVNELKIDRSFIGGIDRSGDDHALVEAIVRLAQTFGLGLIAEGIETEGQREALLRLGCVEGQGYLFSRPIPAGEMDILLAAQAAETLPEVVLPPGPRRAREPTS